MTVKTQEDIVEEMRVMKEELASLIHKLEQLKDVREKLADLEKSLDQPDGIRAQLHQTARQVEINKRDISDAKANMSTLKKLIEDTRTSFDNLTNTLNTEMSQLRTAMGRLHNHATVTGLTSERVERKVDKVLELIGNLQK